MSKDAFSEYIRVKSGQVIRIEKLGKKTIYIDGHTIGYQFNKNSAGHRIAHTTLYRRNGVYYCFYSKMRLKVQPILDSTQHYEAVGRY